MAKWYNLASCEMFILTMLRRSDFTIEGTQATSNEGKNVRSTCMTCVGSRGVLVSGELTHKNGERV